MTRPNNPLTPLLLNTEQSGDCIIWTGRQGHHGHGVFKLGQRQVFAHRIAYGLANPDVDLANRKIVVRHLCPNAACVNPEHLTHGGQHENVQDMIEARGGVRVTKEEVLRWRELRLAGWTTTDIAKLFKRNNSSVWHALHGNSWRHLFEALPTYGRGKPYRNRQEA